LVLIKVADEAKKLFKRRTRLDRTL